MRFPKTDFNGEAFTRCRTELGWSLLELALAADLSPRALENWEAGRVRRPHTGSLRRVVKAMNARQKKRKHRLVDASQWWAT